MNYAIVLLIAVAASVYGGYWYGYMDGFEKGASRRLPPEDLQ